MNWKFCGGVEIKENEQTSLCPMKSCESKEMNGSLDPIDDLLWRSI